MSTDAQPSVTRSERDNVALIQPAQPVPRQTNTGGDWCDCCTRGEYVYSTFVRWDGPVEGEPLTDIEHFQGWARWDGTSFAAPKVSAAIARLFAERGGATPPLDAGSELIAGTGGVPVSSLTDATLSGAPGVSLPHLQIR